jgi:hypothetical protein
MDKAPVYFIGGTFGGAGGTSGLAIAITTAVVTACGTLFVGWLLENYRRHLDRRSLAAALLSEITSIMRIIEDYDFVGQYRQLQDVLQRAAQSGALVPRYAEPTFRATVYEKCADRIGLLGADEAVAVVRFYGFLNGVRNAVSRATASDLPVQDRISVMEFLNTKLFPAELPKAKALQHRLERVVIRPWRPWGNLWQ